ncbi:hypothetical protein [Natrinema pallidum]|uniref:Uncharacterized protein n=1 Tax=Natrinema pallidum DSM 3751 TaxID=1227495 RepID=L9YGG8_9EURY|nr:hypothetical protein [Natrinema pallidum]ELY73220.1 hypothetical protein C487_17500 [Natrinema pallidum DSM 3751]
MATTQTHARTLERDGDEIVVTQVAPQVYHCVRDGVRHVIEVSWRVGEQRLSTASDPTACPSGSRASWPGRSVSMG